MEACDMSTCAATPTTTGDRLSEQGVADAEAIGQTDQHPPYALFVSTVLERISKLNS
jgi:hypothetical protein